MSAGKTSCTSAMGLWRHGDGSGIRIGSPPFATLYRSCRSLLIALAGGVDERKNGDTPGPTSQKHLELLWVHADQRCMAMHPHPPIPLGNLIRTLIRPGHCLASHSISISPPFQWQSEGLTCTNVVNANCDLDGCVSD